MDAPNQTTLPTECGWLNARTETWHQRRSCAGDVQRENRMQLAAAVEEGYDRCGVCCSHVGWVGRASKQGESP